VRTLSAKKEEFRMENASRRNYVIGRYRGSNWRHRKNNPLRRAHEPTFPLILRRGCKRKIKKGFIEEGENGRRTGSRIVGMR